MINLNKGVYIYDIETDGLIEDATKIHCLSITWRDKDGDRKTKSTTDYNEMRKFFLRKDIIRIGHNITLYDEVIVTKLLGIKPDNNLIDTLPLSWYLYPEYKKHGLEEWGEYFKTPKVEIKDWKNLKAEEYIQRCEVDTFINLFLWEKIKKDLLTLYDNDEKQVIRFIEYLQFKISCIAEQEEPENQLKLDIPHIEENIRKFKKEQSKKINELRKVMPKVPIKKTKTYKDVIIGEEGVFYVKGDMYYSMLFNEGYRPVMTHEVETIVGYSEPNPNSVNQKKEWLFSLGWKPQNIENKRHKKTGVVKKIYKMNSKDDTGEICPSIKDLYEIEPKLELLEGLTVLGHRIGVLENLLKNQRNGYIAASVAGLTNTLRFKHKNIVNLPTISKKYGEEIRSSIIADDGYILCGSDMSGLEDITKQHYIYKYDPKYVMEMRTQGFDPHLDLGVRAGIITQEDSDFYKWYEETKSKDNYYKFLQEEEKRFKAIKKDRHKSKTTNYCTTYGGMPAKIASTANISLKEAKLLWKIYWDRNKAIKLTANDAIVKEISSKKWIYNPISKFWYRLRAEKDRFATLNSSTGVYCFDTYIKYVRQQSCKISLQMHDEILLKTINDSACKGDLNYALDRAIQWTNEEINLNIPLAKSINYGLNYAECH